MEMYRNGWLALIVFASVSPIFPCVVECAQPPPDTADRDYAGERPRIAATEPAKALGTFRVANGFKIEQVAAEPLVSDPIALSFDENGRLFVVEMRGYSEN